MIQPGAESGRPEGWHDSADICALSGDGRHLGHIVRTTSCWIAFDATHMNAAGTDFRILGTFHSVMEAKAAVELASGRFLARAAHGSHVC